MTFRSAVFAFALALMVLSVSPVLAQSPCDHVTLEWMTSQVPLPKDVRIVHQSEKNGLCEVVLAIDGNLVATYAGKDWLIAGQMFSGKQSVTRETMAGLSDVAKEERRLAKEKEDRDQKKREDFFKENAGRLEELVSLTFGPGQAKGFIYVVTDPNCSHCKKLLPDLELAAFEAKVTLKLVIYPLLGKKSRDMAERVLCESMDWEGYKTVTPPETPVSCKEADQRLEKTIAFMKSAGVGFVPMVVASDGSWMVEGSDICDVRKMLGLSTDGEQGEKGGCTN